MDDKMRLESNVEVTGNINCANISAHNSIETQGTISGGSINSEDEITAITDITAGGNITANGDMSCGNLTASGKINGRNITDRLLGNISSKVVEDAYTPLQNYTSTSRHHIIITKPADFVSEKSLFLSLSFRVVKSGNDSISALKSLNVSYSGVHDNTKLDDSTSGTFSFPISISSDSTYFYGNGELTTPSTNFNLSLFKANTMIFDLVFPSMLTTALMGNGVRFFARLEYNSSDVSTNVPKSIIIGDNSELTNTSYSNIVVGDNLELKRDYEYRQYITQQESGNPVSNNIMIGNSSNGYGRNQINIGYNNASTTNSIIIGNYINNYTNDGIATKYDEKTLKKNVILIGNGDYSSVFTPYNLQAYTDDQVSIGRSVSGYSISIGNSNIYAAIADSSAGSWSVKSDKRDKTDFADIENSLEFITKLEPKTFVMNHRSRYIDEDGKFDEEAYEKGEKKNHRRQSGLIAQDVYETMKEVYNDDNYAAIVNYSKYDNPDADEDQYLMSYEALIPFLIGSIKELDEKNKNLEAEILKLKEKKK